MVGLGLFFLVLGANSTGYLLPWDQLAYWAVTVSTGMLAYVPVVGSALQSAVTGGEEIGARTLLAFYAGHTALIPAAMLVLMAFQFWQIRKAGGLVIPRSPDEGPSMPSAEVPSMPNLFLRETTVALVVVALAEFAWVAVSFWQPRKSPSRQGQRSAFQVSQVTYPNRI